MKEHANSVQGYIERQPEAIRRVLAGYGKNLAGVAQAWRARTIAHAVLIGIGSSFHAVNLARQACERLLGVSVFSLTPEQAAAHPGLFGPQTLAVAASQSGTSGNTLECLRALKARGCRTVAVTQSPDAYVGREADDAVLLDIPEETAGPKTMGVVGTAFTVMLLSAALGQSRGSCPTGAQEELVAAMARAADSMEENIAAAKAYVQALGEEMAAHSAWAVVGRRGNHAAAGEAALKIVETLRRPTVCYELEEAVHGPCASFGTGTALLYLGTDREEARRPQALCGLCEAAGGRAYRALLGEGAPGRAGRTLLLRSAGCADIAPTELLIPAQVISAYVPPLMGIDIDASTENEYTAVLAGHLA